MTVTRLLTYVLGAALALSATPSLARDCTAAEKRAADRQLWLNERDRQLSIDTHMPWGAPPIGPAATSEWMLSQRDYVILYDGDLRVPLFTAERVDADRLGKVSRTDCFRRDVRINASQASRPSDYDEAIFDQGHMAAFANQSTSRIAGNNSFVMSNMVPQTCQFNRGIWQILEGLTRLWAEDRRTVFVVSGSIFDRDSNGLRDPDDGAARMKARNGTARVAIPTAFYKIVASEAEDGTIETLSVLLPHDTVNPEGEAARSYLTKHITTVADLERRTGLDFFPNAGALTEATALWAFDHDDQPSSLCEAPPNPAFAAIWRSR